MSLEACVYVCRPAALQGLIIAFTNETLTKLAGRHTYLPIGERATWFVDGNAEKCYFMRINADFHARALIGPDDASWIPSPMAGVERKMLDRVGGEVARATSLVRYAPNSRFAAHTHGGGEEFLVLEGIFSDENADYPAGSYVRNPIGSSHAPHSVDGCTIFVKLHQFDRSDIEHKVIDTASAEFSPGVIAGLSVLSLHEFGTEHTALVRWAPGARFPRHRHWGGEEILVLEGTFQDELGDYPAGTWLRNPHCSEHTPFSSEGCLIYVKVGHLSDQSRAA